MADNPQAPVSPPGAPARERFAVVLWRRKWILILTALLVTGVTAAVSKSLPEEYDAKATLWITEETGTAAFDAVQAGEVLARTYAQVADSPILADRVAVGLPFEASGGDVQSAMDFEPVSETQLLRIEATDGDPERARILANAYAEEFIDYSRAQLGETVASQITFADRASTPSQPARPQPTLYTLVGALLGLIAGTGMAFLAELLDRRVRSNDELEELLAAPILAQVPQRTRAAAAEAAFEETFRVLRTNLQFMNRDGVPLRSLTVVSPSEGDGKSSVAFHLAVSMAEAGYSVILVEADMRRPGLRRLALPDHEERITVGLSTFLTSPPDLDAVLYQTDHEGLMFIPAGVLPPAPSTLLDAARSRMLFTEAQRRASMVIVDTPPLSVGAEAATLAASADGALMVVDPRISRKAAVRRVRQQLSVVGASLIGVVVNRVKTLTDIGAYAYRYEPAENGRGRERRSRRARRREARERQRQA
jgi:capsular exopolysaccharide synthesis family protein